MMDFTKKRKQYCDKCGKVIGYYIIRRNDILNTEYFYCDICEELEE